MSSTSNPHSPAPRANLSFTRRFGLLAGAALLSVGVVAGAAVGSLSGGAPAIAEVVRSAGLPSLAGPASFADIVAEVKPAVVSVRVQARAAVASDDQGVPGLEGLPPGLERFFRDRMPNERMPRGPQARPMPRQSQGSGFFISADGYVVTNNHVVAGATEVQLVTDDGRTLDARVVGTDPRTDLALLKVDEGGSFPFVKLSSDKPRIGDWVLAVGNPFGLGGTVTAGIVSAQGRDIGSGPYDDYLQIDAAVNRGNSGGPTFNARGEVVGVNTAIFSPSGGNVGIAFAIPASTVEQVVTDLRTSGSVARGFIGVQIQPVTAEIADAIGLETARGALVADAAADGPAAKAGIRRGDTILSVDGQPVRDARDLSRRIAQVKPGESVKVTVWRDGTERSLAVTVARQPAA